MSGERGGREKEWGGGGHTYIYVKCTYMYLYIYIYKASQSNQNQIEIIFWQCSKITFQIMGENDDLSVGG